MERNKSDRATLHAQAQQPDDQIDIRAMARLLTRYRWWILAVAASVLLSVTMWTLRETKMYQAAVVVEYDPDPPRPLGKQVEDVAARTMDFRSSREWIETQNRALASMSVAQRVVRELGLHGGPGALAKAVEGAPEPTISDNAEVLLARLKVEGIRDTRLVRVLYEDANPDRAALIANALVDEYRRKSVEDRLESTTRALSWLTEQLGGLRNRLEGAELQLHELRKDHDVFSLSLEDRQQIVSAQIGRYSAALTEARERKIALRARLNQLRESNRDDPLEVSSSVLDGNPEINAIRDAFRNTLADMDVLAPRYGANHPEMLALGGKLQSLRGLLRKRIDTLLASADGDLHEIDAVVGGLNQELASAEKVAYELSLQEIGYRRLQRERDNAEKLHTLLLERTTETDLNKALSLSFLRVVDPASAPKLPISPKLALNVGIGAFLGLLLGVATALFLNLRDQSVRSTQQVEAMGAQILGVMPSLESTTVPKQTRRKSARNRDGDAVRDLFVLSHPRSAAAECCRTIRTNLVFMSAARPTKTLLVTSASPRDGKTTTAINLAITLAQNGKKVLLVDTDLRRPRVHRAFGHGNTVGVTSILIGEASLESAVLETNVTDLVVLPAGPIPPNPSELLHTQAFSDMIAEASARFDLVMFDSPPLAAVTDAAIIASQVNGVIVVAHATRTKRPALASSLRKLRDLNVQICGVILNDVNLRSGEDTAGGEYYYYGGYYREPERGSTDATSSLQGVG